MLSNEFLRNISAKAAQIFPAASTLQAEIEANMYELLQASFAKLNLVTREEFDTQQAVLARAESTIAEMEAKITELEAKMID